MNLIYGNEQTINGIDYPNPQFKNINKILIKGDGSIPMLTRVYGNNKKLIDLEDFNEYGWEYIVEKYNCEYEDRLNLLDDNIKQKVGNKYDNIKQLDSVLIPTISKKTLPTSIEYFGTITINDQRLLMVKIPPKYTDVEFYDELEPDKIIISASFDNTEVNYYKILWFVTTLGGENKIEDINLSYISWLNSKNPNRNLNKYLLRNTNELIDVCEYYNNEWKDLSSGTLLGNHIIESPTIFNEIVNKSKLRKNIWNRNVSYFKGQIVYYNNDDWVSLEDNNKNNDPYLSDSWIRDLKRPTNITQGYVEVLAGGKISENAAKVVPGFFTTSKNEYYYLKFDVIQSLGYVLSSVFYKYGGKIDGLQIYDSRDQELIENECFLSYRDNDRKLIIEIPQKNLGHDLEGYIRCSLYFNEFYGALKYKFNKEELNNLPVDELKKIATFEDDLGNDLNYFVKLGKPYNIKIDTTKITTGNYRVSEIKEVKRSYYDSQTTLITLDSSNNKTFSLKGIADLPAKETIYEVNLVDSIFNIKVIEYLGLYVDSVEKTGIDTDQLEFRLYPIDSSFNESLFISVDGVEGELLPYPESQGTIIKFDKSITVGSTIITITRTGDKKELLDYYRLIVNDRRNPDKTSKITKDLNIKVWK